MDIAIVGAAGSVGRTIAQMVVEERLLQCDEKLILVGNPEGASAKHLGRKRVTGMGSFLDSLRFRREIAQDLGVRRQSIHGFMVGEHGFNAVPLWSSVHAFGYRAEQLQERTIDHDY